MLLTAVGNQNPLISIQEAKPLHTKLNMNTEKHRMSRDGIFGRPKFFLQLQLQQIYLVLLDTKMLVINWPYTENVDNYIL